jgi:hypothetical protein
MTGRLLENMLGLAFIILAVGAVLIGAAWMEAKERDLIVETSVIYEVCPNCAERMEAENAEDNRD